MTPTDGVQCEPREHQRNEITVKIGKQQKSLICSKLMLYAETQASKTAAFEYELAMALCGDRCKCKFQNFKYNTSYDK